MKLSEAIRLGAMTKPQGFGGTHTARTIRHGQFFPEEAQIEETCAVGAAMDAIGVQPRELTPAERGTDNFRRVRGTGEPTHVFDVPSEWIDLLAIEMKCPICDQARQPLRTLIPHLNDDHRLTREEIADVVATVEKWVLDDMPTDVSQVCQ
jgi:hypothetical protein